MVAVPLRRVAGDAAERFRVLGELGDVDEREILRSFGGAGDDEARDLHHLTLATCGRSRRRTRRVEVFVRAPGVPSSVRQYGSHGMVDRGHGATLRRSAYSTLTRP